jgi:hypothetical protein
MMHPFVTLYNPNNCVDAVTDLFLVSLYFNILYILTERRKNICQLMGKGYFYSVK